MHMVDFQMLDAAILPATFIHMWNGQIQAIFLYHKGLCTKLYINLHLWGSGAQLSYSVQSEPGFRNKKGE